jgi:hypothetical protein
MQYWHENGRYYKQLDNTITEITYDEYALQFEFAPED